jgi:hypothetical protein
LVGEALFTAHMFKNGVNVNKSMSQAAMGMLSCGGIVRAILRVEVRERKKQNV